MAMSVAEYGYGGLEERAQSSIRRGGVLVEFEERKRTGTEIKINTDVRRDRPEEMYFGRRVYLFRKEVGLFQYDLAEQIGIPTTLVENIERGKTKEMRLQVMRNLVATVEKYPESNCAANLFEEIITSLDAVPGNNKEIIAAKNEFKERAERFEKEKLKREQDKNWLPVIQKVGIHRAVTFLRLSAGEGGQNVADFAEENSIPYDTLKDSQKRTCNSSFLTLRNVIAGTELQPDGKSAQLLYLQAANRNILSISDLAEANFGELASYLRIAKGVTQKELAKEIHVVVSKIKRLEYRSNSLKKESIIDDFINWINPGPILQEILITKAQKRPLNLSEDKLALVKSEKFLFSNLTTEFKKDDKDLQQFENATVGEIICSIRKERNLSVPSLAEKMNQTRGSIYRIENDTNPPRDLTIAKIMIELGYNIYDPVAQLVFEKAQKERLERRKRAA